MAIFICWSGAESKRFAEDTRRFLEQVLPGVEFFLSADIEKGALWFCELTSNLQKAKAGVGLSDAAKSSVAMDALRGRRTIYPQKAAKGLCVHARCRAGRVKWPLRTLSIFLDDQRRDDENGPIKKK